MSLSITRAAERCSRSIWHRKALNLSARQRMHNVINSILVVLAILATRLVTKARER
ncbi:MAG: hypothetical protein ACTXOO_05335 [Sodalis sp. (in: enterobacteria)]